MKKLPDYGDLFTLEEFVQDCKDGWLMDSDGSGNYSDGKMMSDIDVYPSEIVKGNINKSYTHVIWFNS